MFVFFFFFYFFKSKIDLLNINRIYKNYFKIFLRVNCTFYDEFVTWLNRPERLSGSRFQSDPPPTKKTNKQKIVIKNSSGVFMELVFVMKKKCKRVMLQIWGVVKQTNSFSRNLLSRSKENLENSWWANIFLFWG